MSSGHLQIRDRVRFSLSAGGDVVGTGSLMKTLGKDRWVVAIDGQDKTKIFTTNCLEKIADGEARVDTARADKFYIIGTWDDWDPREMIWSGQNKCEIQVTLGDVQESFKLLKNNDFGQCVYPDKPNATIYEEYTVIGPDKDEDSFEWTIGRDPRDRAQRGARFNVHLLFWADGRPKRVGWELLSGGREDPPPKAPKPALKPGQQSEAQRDTHKATRFSGQEQEPQRRLSRDNRDDPRGQQDREQGDDKASVDVEAMLQCEKRARDDLAKRLEYAAQAEMRALEDKQAEEDSASKLAPQKPQGKQSSGPNAKKNLDMAACVECRKPAHGYLGGEPFCRTCLSNNRDLQESGWDASVVCEGYSAAEWVAHICEDRGLLPWQARRCVMEDHYDRFCEVRNKKLLATKAALVH